MSDLSTLLVIDADNNALDRVAFGFEREGMLVARTAKPEDAGNIVRESRPQVIVAGLPGDAGAALELLKKLKADGASGVPVLLLGSPGGTGVPRDAALKAGAAEFLPRPAYIRDIVTAARMVAGTKADVFRGNIREIGIFQLLRAMDATFRSGALALERPGPGGARKAMIQFNDGEPVVASIGDVSGLPALQRLLLWGEGTIELRFQSILRPGKPLADTRAQVVTEVLDFMKAIGDLMSGLGTGDDLYTQDPKRVAEVVNQIPKEVAPVIRLFDGKRTLCDVTDESPFRPRDTLRVANKLRGMGILKRDDKKKRSGDTGQQPAARPSTVPPAAAPPPTPVATHAATPVPPKPSANPWVALAGGKPSVNPSYAAVTAPGLELRGEIKSAPTTIPPSAPAESVVTETQEAAPAAKPKFIDAKSSPKIQLPETKSSPKFIDAKSSPKIQLPETKSSPKIQLPETKSSPRITGSGKKAERLPSQGALDEGALERGLEAALEKPKRTTGQQMALPGVAPFEPKREGLEAVLDHAQRARMFAEGARPVAPDEANRSQIEANLAAVSRAIAGHDDERTIPVDKLSAAELGLAMDPTAAAPTAAPVTAPAAIATPPAAPAPVAAAPAPVAAAPAPAVTAPPVVTIAPAAAHGLTPTAHSPAPVAHPQAHAAHPQSHAAHAPPPTPAAAIAAARLTPASTAAAAKLPGVTPQDVSRQPTAKLPEKAPAPPSMRHGSDAKGTRTPAKGAMSLTPGRGVKFTDMEEDFFAGAAKLHEEQPVENFDDLDPVGAAPQEEGGWRGLFGLFGGKKKPAPTPTRKSPTGQHKAASPGQGKPGQGKPGQPAAKPVASSKHGTGPKKKR